VDAERDALAAGLVAGDTLDVDNVFKAVDGGDLALAALVAATDDGDLVILADGNAANVVLLTQLLAEGSAHDDTALARGSLEVSGTALAAGRGDHLVGFGWCWATRLTGRWAEWRGKITGAAEIVDGNFGVEWVVGEI
jgi:hypothetical protein